MKVDKPPIESAPDQSRTQRAIGLVKRHGHAAAIVGVMVVALTIFALFWFQPWKLIQETTLNEAAPTAGPPTAQAGEPGTQTPASNVTILSGPFQSLEHRTTGTAEIIRLADGKHVLRFEDLDTSNGPDLRVYLSEVPASDDWHAYGGRGTFIDLGPLRANRGDANYTIPSGTDLSQYKSAVIWCVRFTVGFGVAPLNAA